MAVGWLPGGAADVLRASLPPAPGLLLLGLTITLTALGAVGDALLLPAVAAGVEAWVDRLVGGGGTPGRLLPSLYFADASVVQAVGLCGSRARGPRLASTGTLPAAGDVFAAGHM